MLAYCQGIWRYRYFWLSLVKMDLRSRYRGSVLGMGWSLLHPIAMTAIFTIVFATVFHKDPASYGLYVLTGLACWNFLLTSAVSGCNCYFQAESYIRQQPVPLAIYPLRIALGTMFHFLIALFLCLILAASLGGGSSATALVSLLPSCLLLLMLGWALAVLGGLATVYFRDTRHLTEIAFQVLFYMTPIFYNPLDMRGSTILKFLSFNPVFPFLDLIRMPLLEGAVPSLQLYAKAGTIVVVALVLASYALARLERRVIFHL